jgi:hypothetical protein
MLFVYTVCVWALYEIPCHQLGIQKIAMKEKAKTNDERYTPFVVVMAMSQVQIRRDPDLYASAPPPPPLSHESLGIGAVLQRMRHDNLDLPSFCFLWAACTSAGLPTLSPNLKLPVKPPSSSHLLPQTIPRPSARLTSSKLRREPVGSISPSATRSTSRKARGEGLARPPHIRTSDIRLASTVRLRFAAPPWRRTDQARTAHQEAAAD